MKKFYLEEELVFGEKPNGVYFQDLVYEKFNRLTVIGYAEKVGRNSYWFCKCECGNIIKTQSGGLKNGHTNSCGCFHIQRTKESGTKHGYSSRDCRTPIYSSWCNMLSRCRNENTPKYHNYGGRGIKVCERWEKFENFIEDMGNRPRGTTIERINNNGNYEPSNCRWATRKEQDNNRRDNHLLEFGGKTQTLSQWAEEIGMKPTTLSARINDYSWPIEKALTEKVGIRSTVKK